MLCVYSNLLFLLSSFPPILLYSDHRSGYGGHDQHDKRLDGEPSEICPFTRRHSVLCFQCGQPRRADSHLDRRGLPALQLLVSLINSQGASVKKLILMDCFPVSLNCDWTVIYFVEDHVVLFFFFFKFKPAPKRTSKHHIIPIMPQNIQSSHEGKQAILFLVHSEKFMTTNTGWEGLLNGVTWSFHTLT